MKVAELKQKIEPYKAAQLRRLVVEMYKAMPKSLKQGKGIDELICNPASGRKKQEAETPIDMGFLGWKWSNSWTTRTTSITSRRTP